jgi:hypothetical protein
MTPAMMMRHLRRALEVSLSDVAVDARSIRGPRAGALLLFTRVLDAEKAALPLMLDRFVEARDREPRRTAMHTIVGPPSLAAWSRLHGVRFTHHFRQFGLVRPWEAPRYWVSLAIPVAAAALW